MNKENDESNEVQKNTDSPKFLTHKFKVSCLVVGTIVILIFVSFLFVKNRYSYIETEQGNMIVDNYLREVFFIDETISHKVSLKDSEKTSKELYRGTLWGKYGNISISANIQFINGFIYYRFDVREYNDEIKSAVQNSSPITFDLQSLNNVPIITIQTNFDEVTRIVDDNEKIMGISFTGEVLADLDTFNHIENLGTRFPSYNE